MKSALALCSAAFVLAGCAGGIAYRSHGEWLDHVSTRPAVVEQHTPEQQQALQAEAARLRAEGEALRQQMAMEKSRVRRVGQLGRLEEIGDELRPVEKALLGGPMPPRYKPEPTPASSGA
jgi:alkylation response protein AidB-like acyl-CoA dehydrogenase